MEDFILDNIQVIVGGICSLVTLGIVIKKKKSQKQVQTMFVTTQFKKQFKQHEMQFNNQFKENKAGFIK